MRAAGTEAGASEGSCLSLLQDLTGMRGVVEVDGLRVGFDRRGDGDPVVFVHGYVGDGAATWRPQLDVLSEQFELIAVDLPGAGESADPDEAFGLSGFAGAVADLITALDLAQPHLVGLSFGGAVAIEFCRSHQDRISTLTLVGAYAGWGGSLDHAEVQRRLEQALRLSELGPQQLVDALLPTMFTDRADPDVVAAYGENLASFHPAGLRAMARACAEDVSEVVPSIRVPTLLVYGAEDTRAPAGVAHELLSAIPEAELIQLPGAGHACNVDAANEFNQVLTRFLHAQPA